MPMRWLIRLAALAIILVAVGLWVTRPKADGAETLAGLVPNADHGEQVFHAAGCASCHRAKEATDETALVLSGGQTFPSPFGSFTAPNISTDPEAGIGGWSAVELWNALHHGTSPEGRHYYPVFPYASYVRMAPQDVVDLHAFLQTLPADPTPNGAHDVPFPFSVRAALGGWKMLFLNDNWVMQGELAPDLQRGRYLVEAMGHCAECHTPRNLLGGLKAGSDWMTGAPNPAGRGTFPDLTPPKMGWSKGELVEYFTSGFTPEFDTAGGHMALVVENLAQLPESDREAIAAYIKALPLD
jgi:mono/diheme cytochrome c family protein